MRYMLLIAASCCVIVPINGQQTRTKSGEDQKGNRTAQAPTNDAISVDTVNINKLNIAEQTNPFRKANQNANKPPTYFRRLVAPENLPNFILCFVGAAGVVAAICTLRIVREQTDATKVAADAALLNAQAVINAERAWVLVKIQNVPEPPPDALGVLVLPIVTNHGKTTGRVVKFAIRRHVASDSEALPAEPQYQGEHDTNFILPPNEPVQPMSVGIPHHEFEAALFCAGFIGH
jgi:hypothetical protein